MFRARTPVFLIFGKVEMARTKNLKIPKKLKILEMPKMFFQQKFKNVFNKTQKCFQTNPNHLAFASNGSWRRKTDTLMEHRARLWY